MRQRRETGNPNPCGAMPPGALQPSGPTEESGSAQTHCTLHLHQAAGRAGPASVDAAATVRPESILQQLMIGPT